MRSHGPSGAPDLRGRASGTSRALSVLPGAARSAVAEPACRTSVPRVRSADSTVGIQSGRSGDRKRVDRTKGGEALLVGDHETMHDNAATGVSSEFGRLSTPWYAIWTRSNCERIVAQQL